MHPIARIGGMSPAANDRILMIEVTDEAGGKSDQVTIRLDDRGSMLEVPPRGQKLLIWMGYLETGLVFMGSFTVDDVSWQSPIDQMTITAKGHDMAKGKGKSEGSEAFKDKTIGDIVGKYAGDWGLGSYVDGEMSSVQIPYTARQRESGIHHLTRLADEHDAMFSVKNDKIVFVKKGNATGGTVTFRGRNAGGILGFAMFPGNIIEASGTLTTRDDHKEHVGSHWDKKKNKMVEDKVPGKGKGPTRHERRVAPSKSAAQKGAKGSSAKKGRKQGQLSITVAGDPSISAEKNALVMGLRVGFDGPYRIITAKHSMSGDAAYTTRVELEKPNSAGGGDGGGDAAAAE